MITAVLKNENLMQHQTIDFSVLTLNILFGAITGDTINIVTAVLSLLFMIVFRLPKFLFYISKTFQLGKKITKGTPISKKDINEIYNNDKDES